MKRNNILTSRGKSFAKDILIMEKVKYVRGKAGRGFFLSKTEIVMFVMLDYPIIDIEKKKKIRKEQKCFC